MCQAGPRDACLLTWLQQMMDLSSVALPHLPLFRWDLSNPCTEPRAEEFPQSLFPLGIVGINLGPGGGSFPSVGWDSGVVTVISREMWALAIHSRSQQTGS